jgi:DtxR family transcriptional regulator, manganese transport regulator
LKRIVVPIQDSITEPHRRTRHDHASETAEDYVEAIAEIVRQEGRCRVCDLAKRFAVSHVTVTKIIARLENEGLVQTERYRPIKLTVLGSSLASNSRHRHEIVLKFLLAIGVDAKTATLDAEGIEHHVSPRTLGKMKSFIENQQ